METMTRRITCALFLCAALLQSADSFVPSSSSRPNLFTVGRSQRKFQLFSSATASATKPISNGILKTVEVPGQGETLRQGDIATIKYACYVVDDSTTAGGSSNAASTAPFAKSPKQKVVVGDGTFIAGWDTALKTMRVGERSFIRITDPALAYGAAGVPPVVPPNAMVEFDVQVLEQTSQAGAFGAIDFDSLVNLADQTPTTAADIAAAFEQRQAAKQLASSNVKELEGLDFWIEKAKNFYFFGLFEGETGERPPWFLRPSITFPIAFFIVGAAFYVTFVGGAIYERGAQVTDELDEVILSSTTALSNPSVILAMIGSFLSEPINLGM